MTSSQFTYDGIPAVSTLTAAEKRINTQVRMFLVPTTLLNECLIGERYIDLPAGWSVSLEGHKDWDRSFLLVRTNHPDITPPSWIKLPRSSSSTASTETPTVKISIEERKLQFTLEASTDLLVNYTKDDNKPEVYTLKTGDAFKVNVNVTTHAC